MRGCPLHRPHNGPVLAGSALTDTGPLLGSCDSLVGVVIVSNCRLWLVPWGTTAAAHRTEKVAF